MSKLKRTGFLILCGMVLIFTACGGGGGGGGAAGPVVLPAPGNVNATDGQYNNRVQITWNAVSGAKSYNVYKSDSLGGDYTKIAGPSDASYDDSGVVLGTTYYYKIAAIASDDTEGTLSAAESGYSDNMPGGIAGLNATNGNFTTKVSITWTSDGNSTKYRVYRCSTVNGSYTQIGESNITSYDDTTITPGRSYYYKVQGVSGYNTPGPLSGYDNGYANLEAPSNFTVTKGTLLNSITLSWTDIQHESQYRIYRATASDGLYTLISTTSVNTISYVDNSAEVIGNPGTSYFYKVAGVSPDSLEGEVSSAGEGYVGLNKPSNVTATNGVYYQSVKISWNAVSKATSYRIYRAEGAGAAALIGSSITTNYSDTTAESGKTYTYKITAMTQNESDFSEPAVGSVRNSAANTSFTVSWNPNREKAVNRSGGGYRVYYSNTADFDINGAEYIDVPGSGSGETQTPTSTTFTRNSSQLGNWYIKVAGYSNLNGTSLSAPSGEITVVVE